ncbi:putative nuclease HARBI1 [Ylistrum balloti]|uniref:putative nuclease HARBI1 n=1 Tax=Ylistrum balloti TaxID=509963 RepID=UPI00290598C1|nr:putative nuclease HARBI1 [Ylistrum balloti]
MVCPTTAKGWWRVAKGFHKKWNFPHCVGAMDGKHIKCPKHAGSLYYNYKEFHSIVIMALVDAHYKFLYVDIGASGAGSDARVFSETVLKDALENGTIGLPEPEPLPNDDRLMPYFVVGDDAFALKTWMMKPMPHRNMSL